MKNDECKPAFIIPYSIDLFPLFSVLLFYCSLFSVLLFSCSFVPTDSLVYPNDSTIRARFG